MARSSPLSLAALAVALTMVPSAAEAQSAIASEEECALLPSPDDELACLREALAASREALRRAEPAPPAPPAPVPAAPAPAREIAATPAAQPAETMGREQVARADPSRKAEKAEPDAVIAKVTDVRTDVRGLLVMQLDNGQIWRQDEKIGSPIRLSENQQTGVEISRSGFGGYRMRFPELGRRIAVSRLR